MAICKACGVEIAAPTINMPREARCYRDHSVIEDCACKPAIDKCRGPWVLDVFKPVPQGEADALRRVLGVDVDD